MLSPDEHVKLFDQLHHIPASFNAKQRQSFKREIDKKLKEHKYASRFHPFEASFSDVIFINRTTTIQTLNHILNLIENTTWFTLDTESTNVIHQDNIPSLIQLQILQSPNVSPIIIVEIHHLPQRNQHRFQLIKQIFDVLLQSTKIIFAWGDIDELETFTQYGLFTSNQLDLPQQLNVQRRFRTYWENHYPHQDPSPNDTTDCKCLHCFGITHDNLISLQDSIAITLHRWIDKRLTRHPFDIGLDPQLQHLNQRQLEYRQSMTTYAAKDCDAIAQVIIFTDIIHEIQLPTVSQLDTFVIRELSPINSPSNHVPQELSNALMEQSTSQPDIRAPPTEFEFEPISDDDDHLIVNSTSTTNRMVVLTKPSQRQTTSDLTLDERKKIHNRSRTLHQRQRLYEYKIVCYNIDSRFAMRKIRQTLDDNHIPYRAINTVKTRTPRKSTLYIGVYNTTDIQRYQAYVQTLFDTRSYNRIYKRNYNYNYSSNPRSR